MQKTIYNQFPASTVTTVPTSTNTLPIVRYFSRHFPNTKQPMRFFSSTSPNPNPNPNPNPRIPKWLLPLSRQISAPSHLPPLLSLSIVLGILRASHLPFFNSLLHSLPPDLSLRLFLHLRRHLLLPDSFTLTSALSSLSSLSLLPHARSLHSLALKLGLDRDTFVLNSLIHLYSSLGLPASARRVFDSAPEPSLDVVSWNTLISACVKADLCRDALRVFAKMVERSVGIDKMTPVTALIACGRTGALRLGRKIHSLVVLNGFGLDFYLGSSLVSMYAKCGALDDARMAFDRILVKNVVCWTSMISGYSQSERPREAVELFRKMQVAGVEPDTATISAVVSSCAQLGALDQGMYLHAYCDARGIGDDLRVKNSLIDMYSKCGDIDRALRIFYSLVRPDVFSWTAMICGLAMNGKSREALGLFSKMEVSGDVQPNEVTFLGVLSACSHGGLVEEGQYYFRRMGSVYSLVPRLEHYGCMVDLLGRAKLLSEAEKFIREMPMEPDVVTWRSLLFACTAVGDVKLAELAAKKMTELEPRKFGGHVLLSNIYAVASRWSDVYQVRGVMNDWMNKKPSCSFIEVHGRVHEFLVSDTSHCQTEDIHHTLSGINKLLMSEAYTVHSPNCFS